MMTRCGGELQSVTFTLNLNGTYVKMVIETE